VDFVFCINNSINESTEVAGFVPMIAKADIKICVLVLAGETFACGKCV
jgi:hypothetical protein